ncbi:Arylsulfatase A [Armadillidium vulgare]|nr:Arylsulfatase A [Armadillidium vulgare]
MKYLCFWVFFIFSRFHFSIHSSAEETILPNGEKEENSPPNIILFLADDLGYGDLGFSGHPTSRTPNIDALAEEGRVFTHFYVTSPVCSPSRSSILTGRYQIRSGTYPGTYIPNSYLGLPHNETTIAKLLKGKIHHPQFSSSKFVSKSPRGTTGDSLLELDSAVQTIKELLERMNLLNNTLIWFTSDNGPSLQRHERGGCAGLLRCGKGTTWEGGSSSTINRQLEKQNRTRYRLTNDLTSSVDILPTIASIAGIDTSNLVLDGFDISQSLFDKNIKGPRKFYAIYPESPTQELGPFAVVYENYKAHFYTLGSDLSDPNNYDPMCPSKHPLTKHDPPLLFNLYADPGERYNLGLEEEYTNLVALIKEWRDDHMRNITWMSQRTQKAKKLNVVVKQHVRSVPTML